MTSKASKIDQPSGNAQVEQSTPLQNKKPDLSVAKGGEQNSNLSVENKSRSKKKPSVFGAILWKNFTLKRKRTLTTICELFVPIFFIGMVLGLKTLTVIQTVFEGWTDDDVEFCPYTGGLAESIFNTVSCGLPFEAFLTSTIGFSRIVNVLSGNEFGREFMKLGIAHTGGEEEIQAVDDFIDFVVNEGVAQSGPIRSFRSLIAIIGNGTERELIDYVTSDEYSNPFSLENPEIGAAIVFDKMDFKNAQFEYRLRMNATEGAFFFVDRIFDPVDEIDLDIDFGEAENYMQGGLVAFQQLVDSFIIANALDDYEAFPLSVDPKDRKVIKDRKIFEPSKPRVVPFPIKEFTRDRFFIALEEVLPLLYVVIYLMPVSQIVSVIVLEKEVKAREMIRLMGVPDYKIIFGWYFVYFLYFVLVSLMITLSSFSLFPAANDAMAFPVLIFAVFLLFGMTVVAFGFVISTFFRKAFNGVVAGLMLYVILFFLFYFFETFEEVPYPSLLIPQVAFAFTVQTLAQFEANTVGVNFELLFVTVEKFSVGEGLIWMTVDVFLWTALGFYFNAVIPGEFGTALPFYFFLQPSYWKKKFSSNEENASAALEKRRTAVVEGSHVEEPNEGLKAQVAEGVGIQVRGLRKVFKTPDGNKVAVNDIDLDVYEGQILVLLGHNGAGKTTTLQMLSGMLQPTHGEAFIYGNSLRKDIDLIRQNLGFCPQHDVLYKKLSVYDHLKFYGALKGLSGTDLEESIDKSIAQVGLKEKKFVASKNLSGGMKRKLSLAISLIGDSKVVFVDEPTSGVDTFSRRAMWEVLQNCRQGRVIILTTHFMDEADLLGDRIAIMAEGTMKCVGSSLFLKQLYGAGYTLTFAKEADCDTEEITDLVQRHIAGSKLTSDIGTELTYYLPLTESKSFADAFKILDEKMDIGVLGVSGYGVSVTTMEEVFLKAGRSDDLIEGVDVNEVEDAKLEEKKGGNVEVEELGRTPFLRQFWAMFLKRARFARRDSFAFVCNTLVPVAIFCVGLTVLTVTPVFDDAPPERFDVNDWNPQFRQKGFLPFLELSRSGDLPLGTGRLAQDGNMAQMQLEQPIETLSDLSNRTLFNQPYSEGRADNCTVFFQCPKDFSGELGSGILDMGEAISNPSETFQAEIEERKGASPYTAVVVRPEEILLEAGACFVADISISLDFSSFAVGGEAVPCSDPESACVMAEASVEFQGLSIFSCLPIGCLSDFNADEFERTFNFVLEFVGLEFDSFLEAAALYFCKGEFCNSPPSSLNQFSICRAGLGEPDELCIVEPFVDIAFDLNRTDDGLKVFFDINEDANYCEPRNFSAEDRDVFPDEFREDRQNQEPPAITSVRMLQNEEPVTSCLNTQTSLGASQLVQVLGIIDDVGAVQASQSTFQGNQCLDPTLECTFIPFGITNEISVCLVDTCLSAEDTQALLQGLLGDLGFILGLFLDTSPDATCDSIDICTFAFDFVQIINIFESGVLEQLADIILNFDFTVIDTILALVEGLGDFLPARRLESDDIVLDFDEMRANVNFLQEKTLSLLSKGLEEVSQSRNLQETVELCVDDSECEVLFLPDVCLQVNCSAEIDALIVEALGPDVGGILAGFDITSLINSAACTDTAALALAGCNELNTIDIANLDADSLLDVILNITNIEAIGTEIFNLIGLGDFTNFETLFVSLSLLNETAFEPLVTEINKVDGLNISATDIIGILGTVGQSLPLVEQILAPDILDIVVLSVVQAETLVVENCTGVDELCVLTEMETVIGDVCLPAGCSSNFFANNSAFDLVNLVADERLVDFRVFTCNSTDCNDACRQPNNCGAEDLVPVQILDEEEILFPNADVCFEGDIRYSYIMFVNTSAKHAVPVLSNEMNTALLRRSIAEFIDFSDADALQGAEIEFGVNTQAFGLLDGSETGRLDVQFAFPEGSEPKIVMVSHPLPNTATTQLLNQTILAFNAAVFCMLAFAFIPGPMISYVVMEKEEDIQIKHLQFVSGAGTIAYWLSNYAFDFVSFLVPLSLSIAAIILFDVTAFIEFGALRAIFFVFLGYGVAIIPFSYIFGHLFKKHTNALTWIIIVNCILGLALLIASFALTQIPNSEDLNAGLKWLFRVSPGFALGDSLLQIAITSLTLGLLGGQGADYYEVDVIGANLVYLYAEGVVFVSIAIFIEFMKTKPGFCKRIIPQSATSLSNVLSEPDEDVLAEEARVLKDEELKHTAVGNRDEEGGFSQDVLRMVQLRKQYGNGKVAVKSVSLGIPEGECFGYLGINGAGKTTTMKCLTGDVFPTSGAGFIKGYNILTEQGSVRQHVGYCSQFSSILGLLTVKEHLQLFCDIKGVKDVKGTIEKLLRRLSLTPFKNKLAKSLSGGNKRKLSVAIAMIGSPAVMLLDEPSTGMDVASRRFMWNVIENMSAGKYDGKKTSVVLTTHSMEECEALCSRVAIMVGGTLRCLGSVQHLKSRFGRGYTIEAKVEYVRVDEIEAAIEAANLGDKDNFEASELEEVCAALGFQEQLKLIQDSTSKVGSQMARKLEEQGFVQMKSFVEWGIQQQLVANLTDFLNENFAGLEIVEAHDYRQTYKVEKNETTRLSTLFATLEENKAELRIAEYAVSQTTLEQIFNGFAAQQEEEDYGGRAGQSLVVNQAVQQEENDDNIGVATTVDIPQAEAATK